MVTRMVVGLIIFIISETEMMPYLRGRSATNQRDSSPKQSQLNTISHLFRNWHQCNINAFFRLIVYQLGTGYGLKRNDFVWFRLSIILLRALQDIPIWRGAQLLTQ